MLTKEDLIHTVTKITVLKGNDECDIGTGFFYKYNENGQENYALVSNKHTFEHMESALFSIPIKQNNEEANLLNVKISINPYLHPQYDVAIIGINDLIDSPEYKGKLKISWITKEDIITEDYPTSSIEYALMIGYPLSFQSDDFVTPLIRSGVIATPLKSKFNGLERFLVDMECFSGSSGSPIFINRDEQYFLVGIEQSTYDYKNQKVGLGECENYNVLSSFLP